MTIRERSTWNNHILVERTAKTRTGRNIVYKAILPEGTATTYPWIIAMHGYTSSSHEWLEIDGYTKGGNLVSKLVEMGCAVAMTDMDLHGQHAPEGQNYDQLRQDNAAWALFIDNTKENYQALIDAVKADLSYMPGHLGCITYSLGGLLAFMLANRRTTFQTITTCVPPTFRGQDHNPYAIFNNLGHIGRPAVLMLVGDHDPVSKIEDSQWLFDSLPMPDKTFRVYDADHSLPIDYVQGAADWIKEKL